MAAVVERLAVEEGRRGVEEDDDDKGGAWGAGMPVAMARRRSRKSTSLNRASPHQVRMG